jgi:hypothetical protein
MLPAISLKVHGSRAYEAACTNAACGEDVGAEGRTSVVKRMDSLATNVAPLAVFATGPCSCVCL